MEAWRLESVVNTQPFVPILCFIMFIVLFCELILWSSKFKVNLFLLPGLSCSISYLPRIQLHKFSASNHVMNIFLFISPSSYVT